MGRLVPRIVQSKVGPVTVTEQRRADSQSVRSAAELEPREGGRRGSAELEPREGGRRGAAELEPREGGRCGSVL